MVILDRRTPELQERVSVKASTGPSVFSVSELARAGTKERGLSPEHVLETRIKNNLSKKEYPFQLNH